MAKRAVPVSINRKHLTAAQKRTRLKAESSVKLAADKIKPVRGMTRTQKKIFKTLVDHYLKTGILSNLDVDTISQAAITIDRLHEIDTNINQDPNYLLNKDIMAIKDQLFKQYMKCCAELYLSPAARAKLGTLAAQNQKDEQDPLIKVLKNA